MVFWYTGMQVMCILTQTNADQGNSDVTTVQVTLASEISVPKTGQIN